MPTPRIQVKPALIDWALSRSGQSITLLEKFPDIPKWKSGERLPTMLQLENFASASFTPLGYFFLELAPVDQLPIPDFRTINDRQVKRPSPNLLDSVHIMERRQEWLHNYLKELGEPRNPLVGLIKAPKLAPEAIEDYAKILRQEFGLADNWASACKTWTEALGLLRQKIESRGITVTTNGVVGNNTHRKLDPNEFRGFVLVDEYAPMVFINGSDSKAAQMFTLAHEVAHIFLGESAVFDLKNLEPADDTREKFCNQLAAEFLVPRNIFLEYWKIYGSKKTINFEGLAQFFKVSQLVVARRAVDLGLITKNSYYAFYNNYINQEHAHLSHNAVGGGDFYRTQNQRLGRLFANAVVSALDCNQVSYETAYNLTGLHGKTFQEYANKLREPMRNLEMVIS